MGTSDESESSEYEDAPSADQSSSQRVSSLKGIKKNQYTAKQRMDMYAFCVLEQELYGGRASIKKQQMAIQHGLGQTHPGSPKSKNNANASQIPTLALMSSGCSNNHHHNHQNNGQIMISNQQQQTARTPITYVSSNVSSTITVPPVSQTNSQDQVHQQQGPNTLNNEPNNTLTAQATTLQTDSQGRRLLVLMPVQKQGTQVQSPSMAMSPNKQQIQVATTSGDTGVCNSGVKKTLDEMRNEFKYTCYSDHQKFHVLTAHMLRNVQQRFAHYYPNSTPPSRTTIKHVYEKCVQHGTVENIKRGRKPIKISQGNEISELLMQEPQLSLRQLAKKLNVSTGTVSRRCKALGLIPDSVTTKHQQLAIARRQKQMQLIAQEKKTKVMASGSSVKIGYNK